MAIDPKLIDSDVTLELDEEDITVSEFSSALEHFLGLVKEVARSVTARRKRGEWFIKVYPGSAGIGLYSKPGAFSQSEVNAIRSNILSGMTTLENGERPDVFSDRAIEHARDLSKVFAKRQKPAHIRVWSSNKESLPVRRAVATTAEKLLDAIFEDDGSVEGTLEVLSGHGKFEVVVFDPIDGRSIKCEMPSQKPVEDALKSFMKRVEVFGKVRYRKDGAAVSVRVDRIVPFPDNEKPDLRLVRGILRA